MISSIPCKKFVMLPCRMEKFPSRLQKEHGNNVKCLCCKDVRRLDTVELTLSNLCNIFIKLLGLKVDWYPEFILNRNLFCNQSPTTVYISVFHFEFVFC